MSFPESSMSTTVTKELLVGVMGILLFLLLLLFFFYLHTRRYRRPRSLVQFIWDPDDGTSTLFGLDPAVIKALPITVFRSSDFSEGIECSVCLSVVSEGEEARLLPMCNHGFHLECIDMWFHSHSTCPLCRNPVLSVPMQSAHLGIEQSQIPLATEVSGDGHSVESQNSPSNVLICSSQDRESCGSSSSAGTSSRKLERMLAIDIPNRAMSGFLSPIISPSPLCRSAREEMKSPASARLRSMKRLLSWGSRGLGSFCSPRGGDIEQGVAGLGGSVEGILLLPRTPKDT